MGLECRSKQAGRLQVVSSVKPLDAEPDGGSNSDAQGSDVIVEGGLVVENENHADDDAT